MRQRVAFLVLVAAAATACIFERSDFKGGGRLGRGASNEPPQQLPDEEPPGESSGATSGGTSGGTSGTSGLPGILDAAGQ